MKAIDDAKVLVVVASLEAEAEQLRKNGWKHEAEETEKKIARIKRRAKSI